MNLKTIFTNIASYFSPKAENVMIYMGSAETYIRRENGDIMIIDSSIDLIDKNGVIRVVTDADRDDQISRRFKSRPINADMIVDFEGLNLFVQKIIQLISSEQRLHIHALISNGTTKVEIRALKDALFACKQVKKVSLTYKHIAAAVEIDKDTPIYLLDMECYGDHKYHSVELLKTENGHTTFSYRANFVNVDDIAPTIAENMDDHKSPLYIMTNCTHIDEFRLRFEEQEVDNITLSPKYELSMHGTAKMANNPEKYKEFFIEYGQRK